MLSHMRSPGRLPEAGALCTRLQYKTITRSRPTRVPVVARSRGVPRCNKWSGIGNAADPRRPLAGPPPLARSGPRGGCQVALQQTSRRLLDYLVGAGEHRGRHVKPEYLGGLRVDHQLVLSRGLHRKVCRQFVPNGLAVTINPPFDPCANAAMARSTTAASRRLIALNSIPIGATVWIAANWPIRRAKDQDASSGRC
jgi:hypothetical protein